jgi:hypothetical protein
VIFLHKADMENFSTAIPHKILFDYLGRSAALETAPDRFTETQKILDLHRSVPFSTLKEDLEDALENVVNGLISLSTSCGLLAASRAYTHPQRSNLLYKPKAV